MPPLSRLCFLLSASFLMSAAVPGGTAWAQAPGDRSRPREATAETGRFGAVAPGVEITIPSEPEKGATFSRHDLVEILAADADYGERPLSEHPSLVKDVVFERDIWALEFTFKPVRLIEVDVPDKSGRMQRKLIWYLIYRVRNTGKQMHRTVNEDGSVSMDPVDRKEPVPFVPRFLLESWDTQKVYPDRVIPVAVQAIQRREDASRRLLNVDEVLPGTPAPLLNTIDMMREIPPGPEGQELGVWGVATWEDIDPTTDHFSIYIQGLTNAYQWKDRQAGEPPSYVFKPGDEIGTGRELSHRTLRLNFWRPGDQFYEHEGEIRYGYHDHPGIERFGLAPEEQVDYRWIYR